MTHQELDKILRETFDDYRVSRTERQALGGIADDLRANPEMLASLRNRAFDIVREKVEGADALAALGWLKDIVKIVDRVQEKTALAHTAVRFSPGRSCLQEIVARINTAVQTIDICVYTITDDRIKRAIIAAHEARKQIRIITDNEKLHDAGSDIHELASAGIPVRIDETSNHMHHKFAIFDDSLVVSGSFNWTRSATFGNHENIIVSEDARIVQPFRQEFDKLWLALTKFD